MVTSIRPFLLASCLGVAFSPLQADGLQKRLEADYLVATDPTRQSAILASAIQEGLALAPGQDLATYLTDCHLAYLWLPTAWTRYTSNASPGGDLLGAPREQFLREVGLPLSAAHIALARHCLRSRSTTRGLAVELPESFHQDLDRAVVLKNAAALHGFFLQHLAQADLGAESKDPAACYRNLLLAITRGPAGYTVQDFKDIFYYQAPDASADYLDEEIFSLYRTLKDQQSAKESILNLLMAVAGEGPVTLPERHRRLQRILGSLAFGSGSARVAGEVPETASLAAVARATTPWALRQGLLRTMVLGEHLAYDYATCLQKPAAVEKLRALQKRLQVK